MLNDQTRQPQQRPDVPVSFTPRVMRGTPIDSIEDARRLLRSSRKARGWTFDDLAALLGCSRGSASQREAGTRPLSADVMIQTFRLAGKRIVLVDDDQETPATGS